MIIDVPSVIPPMLFSFFTNAQIQTKKNAGHDHPCLTASNVPRWIS